MSGETLAHQAALESFVETFRIELGHRIIDPALPEETGPVHILNPKTRSHGSNDRMIDRITYTNYEGQFAMCGAHVQVVLPVSVAVDDPDACKKCLVAVGESDTVDVRGSQRVYSTDSGVPDPFSVA